MRLKQQDLFVPNIDMPLSLQISIDLKLRESPVKQMCPKCGLGNGLSSITSFDETEYLRYNLLFLFIDVVVVVWWWWWWGREGGGGGVLSKQLFRCSTSRSGKQLLRCSTSQSYGNIWPTRESWWTISYFSIRLSRRAYNIYIIYI